MATAILGCHQYDIDPSGGPRDADGDGYDETEDCDDTDAAIHPGAWEDCDGIDNDCDPATVEDTSDADGDGYRVCDHDCDDADPAVNPGVEEICGNHIDDNCDGTDNGCAWSGSHELSEAYTMYVGDHEYSYVGLSFDSGDVNGDGYSDIVMVGQSSLDIDAHHLAYGPTAPGMQSVFGTDVQLVGDGDFETGGDVHIVGDINADGYEDVVGTMGMSGVNGVQVYIMQGPIPVGSTYIANADVILEGESSGDPDPGYALGNIVAPGDVNGDGFDDLLLGDSRYSSGYGHEDNGRAYLLYGPIDPGVHSVTSLNGLHITGGVDGLMVGYYLGAAGDVNGDGYSDFIINMLGEPEQESCSCLRYGPGSWETLDHCEQDGCSPSFFFGYYYPQSTTTIPLFGQARSGRGDLDGDGFDELVQGDHYFPGLFITYGGGDDLPDDVDLSTDADATFTTQTADSDGFSLEVAHAGDVDADGFDDVLTSDETGAFLLYGSGDRYTGTQVIQDVGVTFGPLPEGYNSAEKVEGAGDTNADGYDDLLLGWTIDATNGVNSGAVWVFLGQGW